MNENLIIGQTCFG